MTICNNTIIVFSIVCSLYFLLKTLCASVDFFKPPAKSQLKQRTQSERRFEIIVIREKHILPSDRISAEEKHHIKIILLKLFFAFLISFDIFVFIENKFLCSYQIILDVNIFQHVLRAALRCGTQIKNKTNYYKMYILFLVILQNIIKYIRRIHATIPSRHYFVKHFNSSRESTVFISQGISFVSLFFTLFSISF